MKEKKKDEGLRVKSTPVFKLKDREKRRFVFINFMKQFGFLPETIIVEKVIGMNNGLMIRAILTEVEIKKEDARIEFEKETEKRNKAHIKAEKLKVAKQKNGNNTKSSTSKAKI